VPRASPPRRSRGGATSTSGLIALVGKDAAGTAGVEHRAGVERQDGVRKLRDVRKARKE
jgi:hypothetical protein